MKFNLLFDPLIAIWKKGLLKKISICPKGKKFFPFKVDSLFKGDKNNFDRAAAVEMYLYPLNKP